MAARLTVLISAAMDLVWHVPQMPQVGESMPAQFAKYPGGKGANQAAQAALMGAKVLGIGCVGDDDYGHELIAAMQLRGVDTSGLTCLSSARTATTGIFVDSQGRNMIAVDMGAMQHLTANDIARLMPASDSIVVSQLEVPIAATLEAAKRGRLILNSAPAKPLPDELWQSTWLITPNHLEAEALTGAVVNDIASAETAARALLAKGPQVAVITLGEHGAFWCDTSGSGHIPAPQTTAVDTVGAGDSFTGTLAVMLAEGCDLPTAVARAVQVASVSVTRAGAMTGLPSRAEFSW